MTALDIGSLEQRSAFLDQVCGGNQTFRARIEALLTSYSEAGSLLEYPVIDTPANANLDPIPERPGAMVGPYKLLEQIGEGGMGVVFLAEQSQPVQRTVALKIIKPGMDTRQVMARFAAEKQALALMDHPNIARVLDAGTTESGGYFVMELVNGVPITEYCDAHRLSPRMRLELFVQICRAVQHAHQKGIIHRDLKPANVMMALHDGQPVPKIIDFGVAKSTGPKLTEATLHTELGQVLGTLEYMSPEQAELDQPDVDTRSDIYSLGVLLYELLTGTTPLERQRLKDTSLLDGLRLIREEEPPRPSDRLTGTEALSAIAANRGLESKKLSGQVRGELDWITMKCLEKDRDRRYSTAGSLASDIERYLRDEPVLAGPPSAVYRFRKLARKYRVAIAVAGAFVALLVAGIVVSTTLAVRASQATAQAKANEQRARQAADAERQARRKEAAHRQRAEEISKFLTSAFRGPNHARDGNTITLAELLARSARQVQEDFDDSPTKADLLHIIAQSYFDLGFYRKAIPLWEEVRDYLVRTFGPDHPTALAVSGNLAVAYQRAGRPEEARQLFEETLDRMRATLGTDHPDTLLLMTHLAAAYRSAGRMDEALPLAEQAVRLAKAKLKPDHYITLYSTWNLAAANMAASRLDEALALYDECVRLRVAKLGPDHPDTLASIRTLAKAYATHGRLAEAAKEYTRAFRNHPSDHRSALRAALLNLAAGKQESYEAVCQEMLNRFARTGNGRAAHGTSLACLISSPPVGDIEQLVRLADRAVVKLNNRSNLTASVVVCRTRGLAAYRAGDFSGALKWCNESRVLEGRRKRFPPFIATNGVVEAMALHQYGGGAEARSAFDESRRLIEQHFPHAPANLGADWFNWVMYELLRREANELLGLELEYDDLETPIHRDAAGAEAPLPTRQAKTDD